jgi:hypothetical protein
MASGACALLQVTFKVRADILASFLANSLSWGRTGYFANRVSPVLAINVLDFTVKVIESRNYMAKGGRGQSWKASERKAQGPSVGNHYTSISVGPRSSIQLVISNHSCILIAMVGRGPPYLSDLIHVIVRSAVMTAALQEIV